MRLDTSNWSGEGAFTQVLIDCLQRLDAIDLVRVEDAPASRSEADYNFISNEIYVAFATEAREERVTRFDSCPRRAPFSQAPEHSGVSSRPSPQPRNRRTRLLGRGLLQYYGPSALSRPIRRRITACGTRSDI